MEIIRLCQRNVVTVDPHDDLVTAAALMREKHVGYLVVVEPLPGEDGRRPVGVLTDRDIVITVVAQQTDARSLRVSDVMTHKPVTVSDAETLDCALATMRRIGVRRLPVVDSLGRLTGILALDDVLDSLSSELANVTASIRNGQRMESAMRP